MPKALVICHNDDNYPHDYQVRQYFLDNAPSGWICDIAIVQYTQGSKTYPPVVGYFSSLDDVVRFAIQNGYKIVMRSYRYNFNYLRLWDMLLNNGIFFVGANFDNQRVEFIMFPVPYDYEIPFLSSMISCGSGINQNQTSYSWGLELYDAPPDNNVAESWAVPIVASKIAWLMEIYPSANYYDIRALLRQCSNRYPNWNRYDGYGRPTIQTGLTPEPQPPLELSALRSIKSLNHSDYRYYLSEKPYCDTGNNTYSIFHKYLTIIRACEVKSILNKYIIRWRNFLQTGFEGTYVYINDELAYSGTDNNFVYTPPKDEFDATIKFKTKVNGVFSLDTDYSVLNVHFVVIKKKIYLFLNDYKLNKSIVKTDDLQVDKNELYVNSNLKVVSNTNTIEADLIGENLFELKVKYYKSSLSDETKININRFFNVYK
jgi:hypothetical protein